MHERALMQDLVAEIERLGRSERVRRITRVDVRLGALSHFTPEHFREHFADASRGTLAEGPPCTPSSTVTCTPGARDGRRAREPGGGDLMCSRRDRPARRGLGGGRTRVGRLAGGAVVSLAFVPEARPDDHLLVHLGIPVEVLEPDTAAHALALQEELR